MKLETRLDAAHAAMQAVPEQAGPRLAFYRTLAEGELCLLLSCEAKGDKITLETFDIEGKSFVLGFDQEVRLSAFAGHVVPYAALPGRRVAAMLAEQGLGLGLNLDVAPSSILIPPDAMRWLADTLSEAPQEIAAWPEKIFPPKGLPDEFLLALDTRLAAMTGLARTAYLVGVTYETGAHGHLLGVVDAPAPARAALARAVSEVLVFAGLQSTALDVGFFAPHDDAVPRLAACGLRFDLPQPAPRPPRPAPGSDPDSPPILR